MDLEYATLEEIRKTNDKLERLCSMMAEVLDCVQALADKVVKEEFETRESEE